MTWQTRGDDLPYLGYINSAGFFWGLIALIAGGISLAGRRWATALFAFCLGGWILSFGVSFAVTGSGGGPGTIRFMSASLRTMNVDMAGAAPVLLAPSPTIVAVQEASDPGRLTAEFRRRSGQWFVATSGTSMFLSRYPIVASDAHGDLLKASVRLPDGRILAIWNVHALKDYTEPGAMAAYTRELAAAIREQHPDIVSGDFNATPWNDRYREMTHLMRSSYAEGGLGPGFTFPTRWRHMGLLFAFLRIDHIFVSPGISVLNAFVSGASPGADHYPVVADLRPGATR